MDKRLRRSLVLVILFAGCILTAGVQAATREVGSGYPYTSIQAAINDAAGGDTVLVHDGTYVENINFSGKAITIKSANGAASTVIDGNGSGIVVTFANGEGSGSVLDGFTIMNGTNGGWGAGIYCAYSSPQITNCTISGNTAGMGGAGIYCTYSSPQITNCTISGNTGGLGGGIYSDWQCSPTIINCTISGNTSNWGGGIYSWDSTPTIINCIISGNTATTNGGGIYCQQSTALVKNSILWGNPPNEIYLATGGSVTVTYSDVDQEGYAGSNGNIRQDPLFVDPANGNFSLQSTSPCIDAGTSDDAPSTNMKGEFRFDPPWFPNTGGGTYPYYDMGALEYVDSGWDSVDPPVIPTWWGLNGVHFTSPTEGWAVGGSIDQKGVLLHYSGGTWTSVTPPDVGSDWDLAGVHFPSAKEGWAVGRSDDGGTRIGALLHYSRGKWTSVTPPSVSPSWELNGVHFTSPTEGWAVGRSDDGGTRIGALLHYSRGKWTSVTPPTVSSTWWDLRGVHFTSPTEGWAVGWKYSTNNSGVLLHYSGGNWSSVIPPAVSSDWVLAGVHFLSATEGWAVGYDSTNNRGVLLHYSGGNWSSVIPPAVSSGWVLAGVHFTSATEGWAVGSDDQNTDGALLHYSVWPETFSSKLNVKGFARDSNLTDGWCHIYADGSFYLYEDDHGTPRYYTGTHSIVPGGKTILFTLDSNALLAMQAMLANRVNKMGANKGISVENISFVLNPVSIFKGTIQKKTNAPSKLTIKISGTVSASFDGVDKIMSFTYQNTLKYYSP